MKILTVGAQLFDADRQTDRRDEITVTFTHNFANRAQNCPNCMP
jgi:hypothetical protein